MLLTKCAFPMVLSEMGGEKAESAVRQAQARPTAAAPAVSNNKCDVAI